MLKQNLSRKHFVLVNLKHEFLNCYFLNHGAFSLQLSEISNLEECGNHKILRRISSDTKRDPASDDKSLLFDIGLWIYIHTFLLPLLGEKGKNAINLRPSQQEQRDLWFKLNSGNPSSGKYSIFSEIQLDVGWHVMPTAKMRQCVCLLCLN